MRYVIVGGGIAALGAVEGIREIDKDGMITLVTKEEYLPYSRPGISYWLSGKLDGRLMPLREETFYEKLNIEIKTETEASSVDTKKKSVILNSGEILDYDSLLVATGGMPIFPPISGTDGKGSPERMIFTFTTLKDASDILNYKDKIKRAVVVGGGLIGLKAAEALNDIGIKVTVLELMDRILSAAFDETAATIVAKRLSDSGIEIICGETAQNVEMKKEKVSRVITKSGAKIDTDALVVAIGVRPDVRIAESSGIKVDRGILTDEKLMTSKKGVYAAGDCAQTHDMLYNEMRVTPILPNAYRQGKQAGRNMAGADEKYEGGISMNSIGFYGLDTISIGIVDPPDGKEYRILKRTDEENNIYRKLLFSGERLVGVVLVGEVERAGIFSGIIRDRVDVTGLEETMLRPDFGHVHLDKDTRKERLKRS